MNRRIRGNRKTLIQLLLTAVECCNGRYFLRLKVMHIFNCPHSDFLKRLIEHIKSFMHSI